LTKGADRSRSGLEFSLVLYLARHGWSDELIELAIRHYPHGQFRGGALNERNAERRLTKLLRDAAKAREREAAWQGSRAWRDQLLLTDKGVPAACLANVATILRLHPDFVGKVSLDELAQQATCRDMPWRKGDTWRPWGDVDDIALAEWAQRAGVMAKPAVCAEAVTVVASENPRHPIRAWLGGLQWDGVARLDRWLITYFGADKSKAGYLAKVGAKWLISAVARAYEPGCDAQHLLVLEGPQGIKKSRGLAALVPDRRYFTDDIAEAGTKDGSQDLAGVWIVELSELSAIRRGAIERVKSFLSRSEDHYRPSYGRRTGNFPRRCVFIGTTNERAYLHDPTGGRRFWPVAVTCGNVEGIARDRDQLWAEAVHRYQAGETWHLGEEDEKLAAEEQAEREEDDVWTAKVLEWAARRTEAFTSSDVLSNAINMPLDRQGRAEETRVGIILRRAGFAVQRPRVNGGRVRLYSRPEGLDHDGGWTGRWAREIQCS
jgi:putative DNA primase/helicase